LRGTRVTWIDGIGHAFLSLCRYLWYLLAFLYLSFKMLWFGRHFGQRDFTRQVLMQVYFTAWQAAGPVALLGLAVGVFAIVEGVTGLGALSGAESLGRMVTVIVLREIAPLLTGVLVIVRSVTAITAELGLMRVNREIEAMEIMGIPPIRQLVAPRIVGGLISLFGLSVAFSAVALLGGFVIAQLLVNLPAKVFFGSVLSATRPADVGAFLAKTLLGGLGIFATACYHGLDVGSSPSEVPAAVSRASLNALILLVGVHAIVTVGALIWIDAASMLGGAL
jgi:phospholipid/cholesterol/gamma-HCH transport system permease protein